MDELFSFDGKGKFSYSSLEGKSLILQNLLCQLVNKENETIPIDIEKFSVYEEFIEPETFNSFSHLVRKIYVKISKYFPGDGVKVSEVKVDKDSKLFLTYQSLVSIVYMLMQILGSIVNGKNYEKKLDAFLRRDYPSIGIKEIIVWDTNIFKFFEDFETVKVFKIRLSDFKYDKVMDLDFVLMFYLFFDYLFPYFLEVEIDLSLDKVNKLYYTDTNPFKMQIKYINKVSSKFKSSILGNYIMSKMISRNNSMQKLKLRLYDSYIIETNNIIHNELAKSFNINSSNNSQSTTSSMNIFLSNHCYLTTQIEAVSNLYSFHCEFNSLDGLLFQNVNLILLKNIQLEEISLDLFPKEIKFTNMRKILLNGQYLNDINKSDVDPCDYVMDFLNSVSNSTSPYVLDDARIPCYLFRKFQENLKHLTSLIETKIRNLRLLKIKLRPMSDLLQYDLYTSCISVFIFNLFKILSNNMEHISMNKLKISSTIEYYPHLLKQMYRQVNLSDLKVKLMELDILDIGCLLSFVNFPLSLEVLRVKNLSKADLMTWCRHRARFTKLNELDMEIGYEMSQEELIESIIDFFNRGIPDYALTLRFKWKNLLDVSILTKIIRCLSSTRSMLREVHLIFDMRDVHFNPNIVLIKNVTRRLSSTQIEIRKVNTSNLNRIDLISYLIKKSLHKSNCIQSHMLIRKEILRFLFTYSAMKVKFVIN